MLATAVAQAAVSEEQAAPSNTVAELVVTENPLTPKLTAGQAPFRPPTDPEISNSPPVASSLISILRASIEPSG
ncbi:hypothetical protein D3C83_123050 [compost metagenome]